jgi:hypothetical protein
MNNKLSKKEQAEKYEKILRQTKKRVRKFRKKN